MLRRVSISFLVAVVMVPGYAIVRAAATLPPPTVTTVLPDNTPGLVIINTKPDAWAEVDRFNPLPDSLRTPLKLPFLSAEIDFAQDVQPWLGDEVALALVPTAGSIAGSVLQTFDASAMLLAPIKDRDRFNAFLSKLKATRGQPNIEREYKGVMLLQWSAPAEEKPPVPGEASAPPQRFTATSPTLNSLRRTALSFLPQSQPLQSKKPQSQAVKPKPAPNLTIPEPIAPTETEPSDDPSESDPSESLKPKALAIALLPDTIAIATQLHTLEDLIDARAERAPLEQSPLFQRTLQHPQAERSLMVSYGEVAAIAKFVLAIAKASPSTAVLGLPSLEEAQVAALAKLYSTADSHIWLQPEGIRSQVNFYYTTPQPQLATQAVPDANQILARLPATTYLSASSRNFKQQWQSAIANAQADLTSQVAIASFRNSIRIATGLDPEKDVFPWMDGEYAFFFFPSTGGFFNYIYPKFNLGVGLMIQTSDRPAAEAALKKLDQFVKKEAKGEVAIVPQRLKGQPIVSWEAKDKGKSINFLSHGWLDAKTLVITTGAKPMAQLSPKPYLPLHLNHTFQTATASFPMPNDGYFYMNMGATLSFLYDLILPSLPTTEAAFVQEAQRIAGTVRSVSTTNSTTAEAQRADSLWVLAPVKKPK